MTASIILRFPCKKNTINGFVQCNVQSHLLQQIGGMGELLVQLNRPHVREFLLNHSHLTLEWKGLDRFEVLQSFQESSWISVADWHDATLSGFKQGYHLSDQNTPRVKSWKELGWIYNDTLQTWMTATFFNSNSFHSFNREHFLLKQQSVALTLWQWDKEFLETPHLEELGPKWFKIVAPFVDRHQRLEWIQYLKKNSEDDATSYIQDYIAHLQMLNEQDLLTHCLTLAAEPSDTTRL